MWYLKNSLIFICAFCIVYVQSDNCDPIYKLPEWEPKDSVAPGYPRLRIIKNTRNTTEPALGLRVKKRSENFNVTIFANPFVVDGKCPHASSNYTHLRKLNATYEINVGGNEHETFIVPKAFTGCYYAEITNTNGKKWIRHGRFFKTNYRYHDTILKCRQSPLVPRNIEGTKKLNIDVEVPSTCFKLRCRLFAFRNITEDTLHYAKNGILPATEDCWLINSGKGKVPHIRCNEPNGYFSLNATPAIVKEGQEGWSTKIQWKIQTKHNFSYYVTFDEVIHECSKSDAADLTTWQPVAKVGGISYGF